MFWRQYKSNPTYKSTKYRYYGEIFTLVYFQIYLAIYATYRYGKFFSFFDLINYKLYKYQLEDTDWSQPSVHVIREV